jgi:hypothetical protein
MKNKTVKLGVFLSASVLAVSANAMNWVGYNTDFSTYEYANATTGWQTVSAPFSTLEDDGWVNYSPTNGVYWAANGSANVQDENGNWVPSAFGGTIANHEDAGYGQDGANDAYMNFFADYAQSAQASDASVETRLIRTKTMMANESGDYVFSFDARQGQNPVDGDFGVIVNIWGGEYWWGKRSDAISIDVDENWTRHFINLSIDATGTDSSACNWDGSQGCDTLQLGFYNVNNKSGGVDQNTGVYIDNLSLDAGTYNPVPVPAAAWLFGSAIAGLVGFKRRK